ncbi:MAG: hypothetical protein A2138_20380 [Deltaproteobacteria bacterium RBG_16_71_12]|nr:MAG: hypothetical protein A2138_20380 [Deltaproteobacteria bacterium RBG_16_71_12]
MVGEENRGLREKRWVRAPDQTIWLRKRHRPSRPHEPAIEVFALELARACQIEAAQATLASWRDSDGSAAHGVCVLRFLQRGEDLVGGQEVLRSVDPAYNHEDRPTHTLGRVLAALRHHEAQSEHALVEPFCRVLLFDAWIGNGDRHPGNWSLVRRDGSMRFSPMYDPAASLGAELQPSAKELDEPPRTKPAQILDYARRLDRYVTGCPSGFGDGQRLVPLETVVREAVARGLLPCDLLATFSSALRGAAPSLLRTFDEGALPEVRKRFILAILARRLVWLQGIT